MSLESEHYTDVDDNPAGGHTKGVGIDIHWQAGPLCVDGIRREPSGAFVEYVIEAAINRLEHYQGSKFACEENSMALGALASALGFLNSRTREREARGVEGTHQI